MKTTTYASLVAQGSISRSGLALALALALPPTIACSSDDAATQGTTGGEGTAASATEPTAPT